jgi:hypothetical protein
MVGANSQESLNLNLIILCADIGYTSFPLGKHAWP